MSEHLTVKAIIAEYLRMHGYDGLWNAEDCGCDLDDLMPCPREGIDQCQPGYKIAFACDEEWDGFGVGIGPKQEASDVR